MPNEKQTISNLRKLKSFHNGSYATDIDRAINALEQEPCEDCISRAEAMTEMQMNARKYSISKEFGGMGQVEWSDYLISIKDALNILRGLSSDKQEPKTSYKTFAEWVAREVIDEECWEWNSDAFPEVACRKLNRLGVVDTDGKRWIYENEALEQKPCEDCISRQAVMDCFKKWQPYMATRLYEFEKELTAILSAKALEQEPKTGH